MLTASTEWLPLCAGRLENSDGATVVVEADLEPFRKTNYISRINRAYRPVARELKFAGASDLAVAVHSDTNASVLKNLFTFQLRYDANQWLTACGTARGFPFCLTLPFRNGITFPYSLEIQLTSRAAVRAHLGAWFTGRGRWFTEPANRISARRLRDLRLPRVGWVHASGGVKHTLQCGGEILPPDEQAGVNRWIVYSAYQGLIFRVRPRVDKYLQAAIRLQALLESW